MNLKSKNSTGPLPIVLLSLLGIFSSTAHAADWTVIFRSDDPKLWNTTKGDDPTSDKYAIQISNAPSTIHFLRLTRTDTGAAVIVAISERQLLKTGPLDDDIIWCGAARVRKGNKLLGISRRSWATANEQDQLVSRPAGEWDSGYRGWGFSKAASSDQSQTYSWEGSAIDKTVFEIAVTADDLNDDEKSELLTKNKTSGDENQPDDQPTDESSPSASPETVSINSTGNGPTTQITKLQTSIEALEVVEQPSGGMLGEATRFILTATPGQSEKKGTVPIRFTSRVGKQMMLVLDDVSRAINVHYGFSGVQKIELSFEDKYDPHEGGSIGAAIGTLMLSMIKGFDVDPNLAITGDVSADAKVHRIGGVAAKLRGAAAADCTIVALPTENFDQARDAMVYEGPGIVTDVDVIGISDLDEAAAVARTDRDPTLAKAMRLFDEFRESTKNSPAYLYTDAADKQLYDVLALAPNDISAQLLIIAHDRKLPRLSAWASEYYTFVATNELWNSVNTQKAAGSQTPWTQAGVDAAMTKLNKLRPIADMTVRPWIDAWIDYIRACDEVLLGQVSRQYAMDKYQVVSNEAVKLDANRDLSEKMMHEGI